MSELSNLPNVGMVLEQNLRLAGIDTPEKLRRAGAKEAFVRIRSEADSTACLHMLYGIQGAIEGVRYVELDEGKKRDLKAFYKALQSHS